MNDFIKKAVRVLKVATRPTPEDYMEAVEITGAGIVSIGALGFIISLLFKVI